MGGRWPVIGVDESGKGDFFGPLVVAGVLVEEKDLTVFKRLNVRDSKKISNGRVQTLATEIRRICRHDVVVINPEKYNQLYEKIRNLNRLLGWAHARAIENVLALAEAPLAISDKFGDERFIIDSLQEKGRAIELVQMVRGEAHPAVAAASIVARAEFLRRMESLSSEYRMPLPLGASAAVDAAGKKLVARSGAAILEKTAKIHFRNYKKIVSE